MRIPKLRHHRASGQGFVELPGPGGVRRWVYLGKYGTPEAQAKYDQTIAEWLAAGRVTKLNIPQDALTVTDLIAAYWEHSKGEYTRPDGTTTSTLDMVRVALRELRELYGRTPAVEFGPLKLKALRQHLIRKELARRTVNGYIGFVKRMFKWAASEEKLPVVVYQALATVTGLRAGKEGVRETPAVVPVPEAHIEAIKPHVSSVIWAVVQLLRLTGARPSELLGLRPIDIDTSGKVWLAKITNHKTAHVEKIRILYFGPKAQAILRPFLKSRPVDAFLFNPKDALHEKASRAATHRRKNQLPTPRATDRSIGEKYDHAALNKAIFRACIRAAVPPWNPYRLRHSCATTVRRKYGLEAASIILGHSTLSTTQVYAESDQAKAIRVALEIG